MSIHLDFSPLWVPCVLTAAMLAAMFRPYHAQGDYDFGVVDRLLWLFPIAITWIAFGLWAYLAGGAS